MRLAEVMPKELIGLDEDVKRIFTEEGTLTVAEYAMLKVKYFPCMIEKRPGAYQAKYLMQFVRDLLDVAVTKPEDQF